MKQVNKTSLAAILLEQAFRAFNERYFDGKLVEPIITIQDTPRAYGHATVAPVWRKGGDVRHELNLGAGTLDRPIEKVCATLLHEMVHLWNISEGIQDCCRGGQYHNKKFRDAATSRDLIISYDKRVGWSITEPTAALCAFIARQGWAIIDMARLGQNKDAGTGGAAKSKGSSTRKYVCPTCHMSVRATREVRVRCENCDEMMTLAK